VLTNVLEEPSCVLELDVEVPASTEGMHWGLLPMALPADHADLGTITTIGERTRYAKKTLRQLHRRSRKRKLRHALTSQVQVLGTKVLPSCTASAGLSKAEGREVRACQVRRRAFQHG
jgi:hypothetical protein